MIESLFAKLSPNRDGRDTAESVDQFLRQGPPLSETMGGLGLLDAAKISKAREKMEELNSKYKPRPLRDSLLDILPYLSSAVFAVGIEKLDIMNNVTSDKAIIGAIIGFTLVKEAKGLYNWINDLLNIYTSID